MGTVPIFFRPSPHLGTCGSPFRYEAKVQINTSLLISPSLALERLLERAPDP